MAAMDAEIDTRGVSYGDVVSLFTLAMDISHSRDAFDGHLRADGFIDDSVSVALSDDGELPRHFDECLFQIVPRLNYTKNTQAKPEDSLADISTGSPTQAAGKGGGMSFGNPIFGGSAGSPSSPPPMSPVSTLRSSSAADKETARLKYEVLNDELEKQYDGTAVKFGSYVQLRHVKSGLFLTMNPRLVAARERDCMQVQLQEGDVESAFCMRPKYKLRKDGSTIHWNDECIFANTEHGLSLHCSKYKVASRHSSNTAVDEDSHDRYCECNASPRLTGWRFKFYSSYAISSAALPKALRSGDVIRLQHTESNGYICCEMFSLDTVHVRVAVADSHKQTEELHVGQLWRVEMGSADMGGLATFDKPVRFKHVASGRYLCVSDSSMSTEGHGLKSLDTSGTKQLEEWQGLKQGLNKGSVYKLTTSEQPSELANFSLERTTPASDASHDSDAVSVSDYVFMRSGHGWVHTPKATELNESQRRNDWKQLVGDKYFNEITPTKLGVVCLEDNATHEGAFGFVFASNEELRQCEQLKPLGTTLGGCVSRLVDAGPWKTFGAEELRNDEELAIAAENDPDLQEFRSTSGIESPRWSAAVSAGTPMLHEVKTVLHEISDFIGASPTRLAQKMLRELDFINVLVRLLRHLTEDDPAVDIFARATSRHVYALLAVIGDDYLLNEFAICHLAFSPYQSAGSWSILGHLGLSLGAEHLLAVILSHNMQLAHIVHKDTIDKVVITFVEERRHDKMVLEFLTSLCSCNGKQVRNNQMYIGQLVSKDENRSLFITTTIVEGRLQLSWSWPGQAMNTLWLDELLDPATEDAHSNLFEFYLAQIMLFSEMCYGESVSQADDCVASFFVGAEPLAMFLNVLGNSTSVDVGFLIAGRMLPTQKRARLYAEFCKLIIDRVLTSNERNAQEHSRAKVLIWPGTSGYANDENVSPVYDQLKTFVRRSLDAALLSDHWLRNEQGAGQSDIMCTNFVQAVLRICRKLVTHGLYGTDLQTLSNKSLDALYELTEPLVKLLSHQNDKLLASENSALSSQGVSLTRVHRRSQGAQDSEVVAMVEVKSEVCKTLAIVLKIEEDYFLKRFVLKMYEEQADYLPEIGGLRGHTSRTFENPYSDDSPQRISKSRGKSGRNGSEDNSSSANVKSIEDHLWQTFKNLKMREHKAFDFVRMSPGDAKTKPFRAALSQLLQLGNSTLNGEVLKLAFRKYRLTERLVSNFHDMKLLADDSLVDAHRQIRTVNMSLIAYDTTSSVWISTGDAEVMRAVIHALRVLTKMCAEVSGKHLIPDALRQEILRLEGVHQTVLNILLAIDASGRDAHDASSEQLHDTIFRDCCYFVQHFAASNPKNQLAVFYTGIHRAIADPRSIPRTVQLMRLYESLTQANPTIVKQIDISFVNAVLDINEAKPFTEAIRLLTSVVHCDTPRKEECAHVVRRLCIEGRGSRLLFRNDQKKGYEITKKEVTDRDYFAYEQCDVWEQREICSMADSQIGYELSLCELLYKCCDEDNYTAETISQTILSPSECIKAIETAGDDMFVAGIFALFLDQVYFDVEEATDDILNDESLWGWIMQTATDIDNWAVKVGARNKSLKHANSTVLDVTTKDHYFLNIAIPALEHFFTCYYVPVTRQAVAKRVAEALSFLLQKPTVERLSTMHCAIIASCLDRIRSRGLKLLHVKDITVELITFDAGMLNNHISTIEFALSIDGGKTGSVVKGGEGETRRVQDIVSIVAGMLEVNTSVSVETDFHAIIEILKTVEGNINENLVKLLVKHGTAQIEKLEKESVQELLVAMCRMLRHAVEEEKFICTSCAYHYDVLLGDPKNGVQPGTPLDIIDGRSWRCPSCHGPKSKFVSKRFSIQEAMATAGTAKFVMSLMTQISRQSELIIAREPHVMSLLHECMLLGCTLLSGHNHFVMDSFMEALKGTEGQDGHHQFQTTVDILLGELSAWVHTEVDKAHERSREAIINETVNMLSKDYVAASTTFDDETEFDGRSPSPEPRTPQASTPGPTTSVESNGDRAMDPDFTGDLDGPMEADPRKDLGILTLRLLQQLCGGHEPEIQEYFSSIGTVVGVLNFANSMKDVIQTELSGQLNKDVVIILTETFHALTAFCEGPCAHNQEKLAETEVMKMSNIVLKKALGTVGVTEKTSNWCRLIRSVVQMLRSLLEKRRDQVVHEEIVAQLDFELIADGLVLMHKKLKRRAIKQYKNTLQDTHGKLEDLFRDSAPARDVASEGQHILSTILQLIDVSPQAKPKFETALYGGPLAKISQKFGLDLALSLRFQANPALAKPIYDRIEVYDFFMERVGQLEIVWDGELVREFYPIPYNCYDFEKDETAKKEMPTVLRAENPDQQHQFYLEIFDRLASVVEQNMHFRSSGFAWLRLHQHWLRVLSFVIAVIVNIIIVVNYTLPVEAREQDGGKVWMDNLGRPQIKSIDPGSSMLFQHGDTWSLDNLGYVAMMVLGGFQLLVTALLLLFHMLVQSPVRVQAIWDAKGKELTSTMSRRGMGGGDEASIVFKSGTLQLIARVTLLNSVESRLVQTMFNSGSLRKISFRKEPLGYFVYSVMSTCYALLDGELLYHLSSVAMSALGAAVSPLFLSYHLLSLIAVSEDLQAVTAAIEHTARQVLLTLGLIMVLTYLYTILLMAQFLGYSENDESDEGVRGASCSDLFSCLMTSVDSIRKGGIGNTMDVPAFDDPYRVSRIMFDYSYFIVISVVLLNLVLGIIIDSFAELRKRNEDLDDRLNNVCYICCLERRTLERGENGGFSHHRQTEHNPFFYFYFLMHLRDKMDMGDELSGVESYVQSLVSSGDSSFFPTFQAISVKRAEATSEHEALMDRLRQLESSQERILKTLDLARLDAVQRASRRSDERAAAARSSASHEGEGAV
eukprot:SAG22_NODE_268_length_13300_cov_161.222862_3_plen_2875_part_00